MHPKSEAEMSRCVLLFSSLVAAAMHGKRSCNYFLRPSLPNSLFSMVRQRDLSCSALLIGRVPSAPHGLLFFWAAAHQCVFNAPWHRTLASNSVRAIIGGMT
jgi:hypothetical protein